MRESVQYPRIQKADDQRHFPRMSTPKKMTVARSRANYSIGSMPLALLLSFGTACEARMSNCALKRPAVAGFP